MKSPSQAIERGFFIMFFLVSVFIQNYFNNFKK